VKRWERLLRELESASEVVREFEWEVQKKRVKEALDRMSPVDKAAMYEAQRQSLTYGNVKLHNPMLTREMVADAADCIDGIVRSDT
jgi:predicted thioredoxin/glutaredoxin